jgi:hypothetical protein
MSAGTLLPHPVELIRLHRVSPTFAFADVRIPGVHLRSIGVAQQPSGALRITPTQRRRWGRPLVGLLRPPAGHQGSG